MNNSKHTLGINPDAVPEMLEALKLALNVLDSEPECSIYKAHREAVAKAISKAEGRS